jgi:sec-independent protein translocase protein TatC
MANDKEKKQDLDSKKEINESDDQPQENEPLNHDESAKETEADEKIEKSKGADKSGPNFDDPYAYEEEYEYEADQVMEDESAGAGHSETPESEGPPPEEPGDDEEDDEGDNGNGARMPFLDHLEELRWTILRSLVAIVVASIGCYIFSKKIVDILRYPAPQDMQLIFLSPVEGFMIYIKVSIFAGLVVALPYVAYQFWKFIVPGLLDKERKLVLPIAFFTTVCFLVGASFAYFVIIRFGLNFLLSFQTDYLVANITIGKYLGFVVTLLLVFGVVFELPVLAFFLTKIGILTPRFLREKRRYGIVIIFIGAALLTPPDIFTQLMLAGPLILLYEVSIWVSKSVYKEKLEKEAEEQEPS